MTDIQKLAESLTEAQRDAVEAIKLAIWETASGVDGPPPARFVMYLDAAELESVSVAVAAALRTYLTQETR